VPLFSLIIDTQKDGCENYLNVDHQFLICWLADLIITFFFGMIFIQGTKELSWKRFKMGFKMGTI
jgi:hypothetical protein